MKAEVIKLSEKEIEIDGVICDRRENKFSVDQWVIGKTINEKQNYPFFPEKIKEIKDTWYFPYEYNRAPHSEGYNDFMFVRPATKEEIESHLIKVAKEKGFKEGVKYYSAADTMCIKKVNSDGFTYSRFDEDSLDNGEGNGFIYYKGKWAQILPSKKALPKTKEELLNFLHDFERQDESRDVFVNLYE